AALTWTLRERNAAPDEATKARPAAARLSSPFWTATAIVLLRTLGSCSDLLLLLRVQDLGYGDRFVVLFYAVQLVAYVLAAYPAGILADRLGKWTMLSSGWALAALAYVGFANLSNAFVWPLFVVYGCHLGLVETSSRALVVEIVPAAARATAL